MVKQIDELMKLAFAYRMADTVDLWPTERELRTALEAALKPGDDDEPYECPVCGELDPCTSCGDPHCGLIAPPAQTPPPRLTVDDKLQIALDCNIRVRTGSGAVKFATAIETAVRKQFGVNDE